MRTFNRRNFLGVAAAALAIGSLAGPAYAEYPEKPARIFSNALGEALSTNVVVKTRPGAGGAVGASEVAAAAPDGYTLLLSASDALIWPPLTLEVEYDIQSFAYVAQITEYQQAIIARADAPYNTLEELIDYAKTHNLNYADQSPMSRSYINFVGSQEGVSWTGIPTKGGGEMVPFLLGGKVDFAWSGGIHNRYADDMKVLASMNADRLLASPDVPSISEKYGVAMPGHAVISVPAGTPADIIATLERAIQEATGDSEFTDLVTNKLKFPVKFVGTQNLTADIAETVAGLKKVIETTQ